LPKEIHSIGESKNLLKIPAKILIHFYSESKTVCQNRTWYETQSII